MVTIAKTKQPVRMPRFGHRVDKTDPILRGCVGWWPLNDGAGNIAVDVINGNDATSSGVTGWSDTKLGKTCDFDTTSRLETGVDTTELGIAGNDTAAISAWVKQSSGGSITQNIIADLGSGGASPNFGLYIFPTLPGVDIWRNEANIRINTGAVYGDWVHLVANYTPSATGINVNGAFVNSFASSGAFASYANDIRIGDQVAGNRNFNGLLQNIRIWNRDLSATEVSRLYSEPWAGLKPLSPFSFFSGLSQIYAYYSAAFLQRL